MTKLKNSTLKSNSLGDPLPRVMELNDQALASLYDDTDIYVLEKEVPLISYFKPPINTSNPTPVKDVSLKQVYQAIKGDFFKDVTLEATKHFKECGGRPWPGPKGEHNPFRIIKARKLHYVTFGGTFSQRANKKLIESSGYYCFDLDHLKDIQSERERILSIQDDFFQTNLLFTSPSGEGLKWVISIAANQCDYTQNYKRLQSYLKIEHGIEKTDKTSDVSRACFLCHDPNIYYYERL